MVKNYNEYLSENINVSNEIIIDIIRSLEGKNNELIAKLINHTDKSGKSILMNAVLSNDMELVNYILKFKPDIQHKDLNEQNVLFYCKNMTMFKKFYDMGVNVKFTRNKKMDRNILIHLSSKNIFNAEIYERLIRDNIYVNETDRYGKSVLCYSIKNKNIVELLLKNGAEINDREIQKFIFEDLFRNFVYQPKKRRYYIGIFKILFENGINILDMKEFAEHILDIRSRIWRREDNFDLIDFIKPLKKYITQEILITIFDQSSFPIKEEIAKKLLSIDLYPSLYQRIKEYYGNEFQQKFGDYIKEHPYLDDIKKYNL